jgi:hypothetical protein
VHNCPHIYFLKLFDFSPVFVAGELKRQFQVEFSVSPYNYYYYSSTGTTAHCGLWPVEQDPSIFPICHQLSPSSLNPSSFFLYSTFATISFLLYGVVSPTPNPQPGGPGYPFLSGSSPLTCLSWEALPVAYATASIAVGIM